MNPDIAEILERFEANVWALRQLETNAWYPEALDEMAERIRTKILWWEVAPNGEAEIQRFLNGEWEE